MNVLVFDPGESTGWVWAKDGKLAGGGTLGKHHCQVADLIKRVKPDVVVLETFKLYPGKARTLSWSSFYPVEVIGVIKYLCLEHQYTLIEQAPSVKKYAGGFKEDWSMLTSSLSVTEHTKDAYLHWKYYERYGKK